MSFEDFLRDGWDGHTRDAAAVATRLPDGLALVTTPAEAAQLATLVAHVYGEHLGRWSDGIALLEALGRHEPTDAAAVARGVAALRYCKGEPVALADPADRLRALATAASALCGQRRVDDAAVAFRAALALAGDAADPTVARALAVTGNNLACALEERTDRDAAGTELMVDAARAARRFWAVAGGWLQVERAEYRLARSLTHAGRAAEAAEHARACLALCEANGADAFERFFGWEALALASHAAGDTTTAHDARARAAACLADVPADLAGLCRDGLAGLDRTLA